MGLAETTEPLGTIAANAKAGGEPSVASSLEHLIAGSQGVIAKRIDLALLEGQELLLRLLERTALIGVGIVLAAGAWFAAAAALVLFVAPAADPVLRLAAFALLNVAGAFAFVRLAARGGPPPARQHPNDDGTTLRREPSPAARES